MIAKDDPCRLQILSASKGDKGVEVLVFVPLSTTAKFLACVVKVAASKR
jgi:hypothetical protein